MIILGSFGTAWLIMDIQSFMRSPLLLTESLIAQSWDTEPTKTAPPPQLDFMPNPQLQTYKNQWRFVIKPGSNLTAVAYDLQRQNVLAQPRYLVWSARWQGQAKHIKAGEYGFEPGTTVAQLLEKITTGDVIQYALTIIEGWNIHQLMHYMAGLEGLEQMLGGLTHEAMMTRLDYQGQHPEGRFFPDTYYYTRGMSDVQILKRAYQAMNEFLDQAWQQRDVGLPYQNSYEALIMAAIIEKETGLAAERRQIAGVFIRRLRKRMRLQTDPTVIYGLGTSFDGNLRRRDLKADTPYNTYTRHGLPPSPIAMPGGESITAAMHPADGDSLYFVARGDGSHYFSATNAEHNRAVRQYQLKRH